MAVLAFGGDLEAGPVVTGVGKTGSGTVSGGSAPAANLMAGLSASGGAKAVARHGVYGGSRSGSDGLEVSLEDLAMTAVGVASGVVEVFASHGGCSMFFIGIDDGFMAVAVGSPDPGGQHDEVETRVDGVAAAGAREEVEVGSRKKKRSATHSMEDSGSTAGVGDQFPDPIMG